MLPNNSFIRQVLVGTLIAVCGGSLGFGSSQMLVVSDVKVHSTEITQLKKEFSEERSRTDQRVNNIVSLMEKSTALNQELVGLVKVQIELLSRQRK